MPETVDTPLAALHPAPWNPRVISDPRFEQLCRSLTADPSFLLERPILATLDGTVYAGNMRLRAAEHLGWTSIPARLSDIPEQLAKERALRDNNSFGDWVEDDLSLMLADLKAAGSPLDLLGFDDGELTRLLDSLKPKLTDPDAVPEPPVEPITKPGDLWLLGDHRLLCGDSTKREDVERLMEGERASAVLTDPPYGIDQPGMTNDAPGLLQDQVDACVDCLPIDNAVVVAFQSTRTFPVWLDATRRTGQEFCRMLWLYKAAQNAYPWRGWLLISEAILVSTKGNPTWVDAHPYAHDCYYLSEVSERTSGFSSEFGWHASVKPLSVVADLLGRICPNEAICYEPFSGSGTTIIAAEQLSRRCFAMEIEPKYVDVAVKRWEQFTGQKATLEACL